MCLEVIGRKGLSLDWFVSRADRDKERLVIDNCEFTKDGRLLKKDFQYINCISLHHCTGLENSNFSDILERCPYLIFLDLSGSGLIDADTVKKIHLKILIEPPFHTIMTDCKYVDNECYLALSRMVDSEQIAQLPSRLPVSNMWLWTKMLQQPTEKRHQKHSFFAGCSFPNDKSIKTNLGFSIYSLDGMMQILLQDISKNHYRWCSYFEIDFLFKFFLKEFWNFNIKVLSMLEMIERVKKFEEKTVIYKDAVEKLSCMIFLMQKTITILPSGLNFECIRKKLLESIPSYYISRTFCMWHWLSAMSQLILGQRNDLPSDKFCCEWSCEDLSNSSPILESLVKQATQEFQSNPSAPPMHLAFQICGLFILALLHRRSQLGEKSLFLSFFQKRLEEWLNRRCPLDSQSAQEMVSLHSAIGKGQLWRLQHKGPKGLIYCSSENNYLTNGDPLPVAFCQLVFDAFQIICCDILECEGNDLLMKDLLGFIYELGKLRSYVAYLQGDPCYKRFKNPRILQMLEGYPDHLTMFLSERYYESVRFCTNHLKWNQWKEKEMVFTAPLNNETIQLSLLKISDPLTVYHYCDDKKLPEIFEHLQRMIQDLLSKCAQLPGQLQNSGMRQNNQILNGLMEIQWWLAQSQPLERGSAACIEIVMMWLARECGFPDLRFSGVLFDPMTEKQQGILYLDVVALFTLYGDWDFMKEALKRLNPQICE